MSTNKYSHKDPLCYKVYNWEDGQRIAGLDMMKSGTVRRWVSKACGYYGVRKPKVGFLPARAKLSGYSPTDEAIGFVAFHKNPVVVLHEAAHHIADVLFGSENCPHHTHPWFSIYMWLLLKFEVYEPAFLRGSLEPYGLRLRPLSPEQALKP